MTISHAYQHKAQNPPAYRSVMRAPTPWLVLLLSLVLTTIFWYQTQRSILKNAQLRFDNRVELIQNAILSRLQHYEQVLRGGVALFAAADHVNRENWRTYVSTLRLQDYYPGIEGVGFAQRVKLRDRDRFTQALHAQGFSAFHIWPPGQRPDYYPIIYLEPFANRNLKAFGFDMFSEPVRHDAMAQARDSGSTRISGKVTLVQEQGESRPQAGFLMYIPVYPNGLTPATSAERRETIQGFVYSPFRVTDLMNDILVDIRNRQNRHINLDIYDGRDTDPSALLFRESPASSKAAGQTRPMFTRSLPLTFAAHDWTLHFQSRPEFETTIETQRAWIVLLGGLVTSALLFVVTLSLTLARVRAEALREGAEEFRATFNQAAVGMAHMGLDGQFLQVNQRLCEITGYPCEQLLQKLYQDITHPEDLAQDQKIMARLLSGEVSTYTVEKRYYRPDGGIVWVLKALSLVRDAHGNPAYVVAIAEDITTRRQAEAEIRLFNATLEQRVTERTAELESLTYSLAHDLRTPLRGIEGFGLILEQDCSSSLSSECLSHVSRIRKASKRMAALIDAILNLARISRTQPSREAVNLSGLAQHFVENVRNIQPRREVDFVLTPNVQVQGDPHLLQIALENLLNNAWKFTARQTRARIEFGTREQDGEHIYFVRDNGVGFDMSYSQKLFQPFQRLHGIQEFEGTGIGLATVGRIIASHGGRIWIEGAVDHGTTVYFTLPVQSATIAGTEQNEA